MILFVCSSLMLVLLVVWWAVFFTLRIADLREGKIDQLRLEAVHWIMAHPEAAASPTAPTGLPAGLQVATQSPSGVSGSLFIEPLGSRYVVTPTPAAAADIASFFQRKETMIIGEGSVLFLLVIVSLGTILMGHKRAIELNADMSNFLQAVTHELKSPLTSLRLLLETLKTNPEAIPEPGPLLEAGLVQVGRLERLITNILKTSALESHRLKLARTPFDLTREVRTFALSREAQVKAAGGTLMLDLPEPVVVRYDREALTAVLDNLLDNAIKYSTSAPAITLAVRSDEINAILEVRDRGKGLAPGQATHLFERFWRGEDELTRSSEGTGLGLYLVRQLITTGGGEIGAASPGPGQGTTITVRLPKGSHADLVPTRDLIPAG